MNNSRKLLFFLPSIFTALNVACGFASIVTAWSGNYLTASLLLFLALIFDSFDGKIARLIEAESHFGEQFDSMSDMISFGVAPCLLVYFQLLHSYGKFGAAIAFFYLLCGALRLARFNTNIDKINYNFFQGLPIPSAAMALVGVSLIYDNYYILKPYPYVFLIYIPIYSFLMISNIPFCSFKDSNWVREHKKAVLLIIFTIFILVFLFHKFIIFIIINLYVLISLLYLFFNRRKLSEAIWKE